jgi:hypothetical protein
VVSAQACRSDATAGLIFFTVLALLGLMILAVGVLERLSSRRIPAGPGVVPLRRWAINWRPPYLQVDSDSFHIVVPRLFGNRRWTVPLSQVAVAVAPREVSETERADLEDIVFDEPQRIEMIATRYSFCVSNLMVLFIQHQRIPTVRRFPSNPGVSFTPKETRSAEGIVLAGIFVSATDEGQALAALKGAGVEIVTDHIQWTLDHRPHRRDPLEVQQMSHQLRRAKWIDGLGWGVPMLLMVAGWLATKVGASGVGSVVVFVGLMSFFGFQIYVYVINRHRERPTSP